MNLVPAGAAVVVLLAGCQAAPSAVPVDTSLPPAPQVARVRPSGTAHLIPDAFPLLAGWPEGETIGPSRVLPPLAPSGCDTPAAVPAHVDLLRATSHDQQRQLVTFRTRVEAAAYAASLRGCREHVERFRRHVLVSTDPPPAELADALPVLDNAAERPWLGPQGYGGVVLGMPAADLATLPHSRVGARQRCTPYRVRTTYAGLEPGVVGLVERGRGVIDIALAAPSSTPEGIGLGATLDQVLLAYPRAEGDREALGAPVPGHPDRVYRIEVGPDGVTGLHLMLRDQHCAG